MACKKCSSRTLVEFPSEVAVHFPGRSGFDIPHVFVFPVLVVCFNCGFTEFGMSAEVLDQLREGTADRGDIQQRA